MFICKFILGQRNHEITKMDVNPLIEAYANMGLGMGSLNLFNTSHNLIITQDFTSPQMLSSVPVHSPPPNAHIIWPTRHRVSIIKEEFAYLTMNHKVFDKSYDSQKS